MNKLEKFESGLIELQAEEVVLRHKLGIVGYDEQSELILIMRSELYELYDKYEKEKNQIGLPTDFYKSLEDKVIYIDSNIFMDEKFIDILINFEKYQLNIIIPKEQYDELYNIKQKSEDSKQKKARDAFKIIETFLDLNILHIENINENTNNKNAYADIVFINRINQHIQNKENIVFFTDDADLRIRVKSMNKDSLVKIYGFKDLDILIENKRTLLDEKWNPILKEKENELKVKSKERQREAEEKKKEKERQIEKERRIERQKELERKNRTPWDDVL